MVRGIGTAPEVSTIGSACCTIVGPIVHRGSKPGLKPGLKPGPKSGPKPGPIWSCLLALLIGLAVIAAVPFLPTGTL